MRDVDLTVGRRDIDDGCLHQPGLSPLPLDRELRCARRPWTTVILAGEKVGAMKHRNNAHIVLEPDARIRRPAMVFEVTNLQHSLELLPGSFVVELDGEPCTMDVRRWNICMRAMR